MFQPLTEARTSWTKWQQEKAVKCRMHVYNGDNGSSCKAGTNIEYEAILFDGRLVCKTKVPVDLSANSIVAEFGGADCKALEAESAVNRILSELRALPDVQSIKQDEISFDSKRITSCSLAFSLGLQGKSVARNYESAQSEGINIASLVYRSLFGTEQAEFASELFEAAQFRGHEWTSAAVICRGTHEGFTCSHGDGKKKAELARQRLEELDGRVEAQGHESLGFAPGEQGLKQLHWFRAMLSRFMTLHGDTDDWISNRFLDGIACIVKRSSGGPAGEDGSLDMLGAPNDGTTVSMPRTPLALMASLMEPDDSKPFTVASAKADKSGSLSFVRAKCVVHGAQKNTPLREGEDAFRDVMILYKNQWVARLLTIIARDVPSLNALAKRSNTHRLIAMGILKRFVVAHVARELPDMRKLYLWKPVSSKHLGEKIYRTKDAEWDVERFEKSIEGRDLFAAMKDQISKQLCGAGISGAAASESGAGEDAGGVEFEALMAAAFETMILHVVPQTIFRRIALTLMQKVASQESGHCTTADNSGEQPPPKSLEDILAVRNLDRSDFPFISTYVWEKRIGHTLTHLDAKVSRFLRFYATLEAKNLSSEERLRIMLQYAHGLYPVESKSRQLLCEDDGGPLADIWLSGKTESMRELMVKVVQAAIVHSIATKRHGISGLPFFSKPPNPKTGKGGMGPSLAGYADLTHDKLSLLHSLDAHKAALEEAAAEGGASLLKLLKTNKFVGGGGLCSQRVLTYLEPTKLYEGVLQPYLPGGAGTRAAILFVATVVKTILDELGIARGSLYKDTTVARTSRKKSATKKKGEKSFDEEKVLVYLKNRMERMDKAGDRSLGAKLRSVASGCPALHGLSDFSAHLGNTLLTGGTLETMGCDGIWRLLRPLVLGCAKPRVPDWHDSSDGGNHFDLYPFWCDDEQLEIYEVGRYLEDYVKHQLSPTQKTAPRFAAYIHTSSTAPSTPDPKQTGGVSYPPQT